MHNRIFYHFTLENVEDAYFRIVNGSIIYNPTFHGLDNLVEKFRHDKGFLPCRLKNVVPGNVPPNSSLQLGIHTHLIHRLVIEGSSNLVSQAIKSSKSPQINIKDLRGNTPLHLASYGGKLSIIEMLLKAGANIEMKDKDGKSPLQVNK